MAQIAGLAALIRHQVVGAYDGRRLGQLSTEFAKGLFRTNQDPENRELGVSSMAQSASNCNQPRREAPADPEAASQCPVRRILSC